VQRGSQISLCQHTNSTELNQNRWQYGSPEICFSTYYSTLVTLFHQVLGSQLEGENKIQVQSCLFHACKFSINTWLKHQGLGEIHYNMISILSSEDLGIKHQSLGGICRERVNYPVLMISACTLYSFANTNGTIPSGNAACLQHQQQTEESLKFLATD
jgi:hypothetical protein